jgi:hypothetical protein
VKNINIDFEIYVIIFDFESYNIINNFYKYKKIIIILYLLIKFKRINYLDKYQ